MNSPSNPMKNPMNCPSQPQLVSVTNPGSQRGATATAATCRGFYGDVHGMFMGFDRDFFWDFHGGLMGCGIPLDSENILG